MVEWVADLISRYIKGDFEEGDWHAPREVRLVRSPWDQETLEWEPWNKQRVYRFLGETFCEFDQNIPRFLRLVADKLEGKWPPYSPGDLWYDDKIEAACDEACRRKGPPRVDLRHDIGVVTFPWPTFSEYEQIFLERNAKLPEGCVNGAIGHAHRSATKLV